MRRNAYTVIKSRYMTEKSNVLENLVNSESNASLKACSKPKYVFLVDINANKKEIKLAIEEIYRESNVTVKSVNTSITKPKRKRVRGRPGKTAAFKKAVVTLEEGDKIEAEV
ncbi:MAG: 50S ribosomal protein L23 [Simkaniaceae bacterium]